MAYAYWQGGKEKSLSLGVYPKVSLSDARKKRDEVRKQLDAGLDPSAERKASNLRKKLAAENSFEAVAREWYGKQLHTWVPHHASDVRRRLENNIFPGLGKRPLDEIQAAELLQTIQKIEARGAYDLAHRGASLKRLSNWVLVGHGYDGKRKKSRQRGALGKLSVGEGLSARGIASVYRS